MKNYIVFNTKKEILRTGVCGDDVLFLQAGDLEFAIEGTANDFTQKVEFDGLDADGQPIKPRVVDKTKEEIEADKPTPVPFEKQPANITNEQWQKVLERVSVLESEV